MSSGFKTLSFQLTGDPPVLPLELKHLSLEAEFQEVVVGTSDRLKRHSRIMQGISLLVFLLFAVGIVVYVVWLRPNDMSVATAAPVFGGMFALFVLVAIGLSVYSNSIVKEVRRHCEEVNSRPNVSGRAQFSLRIVPYRVRSGAGSDRETRTRHRYYIDVECSVDGSRVPCAPLDPRSEGTRLLDNQNAVYGQNLV